MKQLFSLISDNFFVPLSSKNKIVYWECICKLFSVMDHQLSFGVERDVLVDELQFYFEQMNAAELDEEEFGEKDSRAKANEMLRRLEFYGWIEIETDKSYIQRVNFKEYAIRVLKTLLEIADGKQVEYQGYIYTIYSLVRSQTDNPGVVLIQVMENTDLLITGLKNLNSNIKHYIDDLTRHSTVAEIMDALFNDYITNIVDKAYHRLLTSDNVSKFRPEIIERLESRSKSDTYIAQTVKEIIALKEMEEEEAKEFVYRCLHEIMEAFRNMDDILNEINKKNAQYQKAAINRARFLLTGSEDIRGQIKELLLGLNDAVNREAMDLGGIYEVEFLEGLIRIYSCSVLDSNSFYTLVEGRKEFQPQVIEVHEPDELLRQEKLRRMVEKVQRALSPEKINAYVEQQLGGRMEMLATELPLGDVEDFVKIIYTRLYGQRKNMKYQIELKTETEFNGFRFKDYVIRRK